MCLRGEIQKKYGAKDIAFFIVLVTVKSGGQKGGNSRKVTSGQVEVSDTC